MIAPEILVASLPSWTSHHFGHCHTGVLVSFHIIFNVKKMRVTHKTKQNYRRQVNLLLCLMGYHEYGSSMWLAACKWVLLLAVTFQRDRMILEKRKQTRVPDELWQTYPWLSYEHVAVILGYVQTSLNILQSKASTPKVCLHKRWSLTRHSRCLAVSLNTSHSYCGWETILIFGSEGYGFLHHCSTGSPELVISLSGTLAGESKLNIYYPSPSHPPVTSPANRTC